MPGGLRGNVVFWFCFGLALCSGPIQASDTTVLFLGNSLTYGPGSPEAPRLPGYFKRIAESIDRDLILRITHHTQPGWSYRKHFASSTSRKLLTKKYDKVVLQGHSIESLELPIWFTARGWDDVQSFAEHLPKVLTLALKKNSDVTLFVNWAWGGKNPLLQETVKDGDRWCGKDQYEFQTMIDRSYAKHAGRFPVRLSMVGAAWLGLQTAGVVGEDELYQKNEWRHSSELGAFVGALVLVRDVLHLDLEKLNYFPANLDRAKLMAVARALAKSNAN